LYYARDGESLTGLNIDKIERIRKQNTQEDWSAQIIEAADINDLSPEAILKAREQYAEKNPKQKEDIAQWDDIKFLNKAKVCINGKITNTAILLLGKPESEHFINPSSAKISWILKDRDNIEKDYEHFICPLLLEVENVYAKIRNLKYRYLQSGTLFPDEVDQFEPYIIREAINNCIAHQDYSLGGKINVVEREDGILTFINSGSFIPGSVEKVIIADAPETEYRNPFLANAMVNLNMIDTIGSGIKKMFVIQKNKFFPLPDYDLSDNKVKVQIIGKVIDVNYARKLAQFNELSIQEIFLLDKVAKHKPLKDFEIKELKSKKLIEGRKPNFHISSAIAKATGEKASYIKQRGIDDEYCQKIILDYLRKFKEGKKADFEKVLLDKLPDVLDIEQKKNKIKNNLQYLRRQGYIEPKGKLWQMSKTD
jgi:ATP-dependent DNA helicase RecG